MPTLNIVISHKAKENFQRVGDILGLDQHETATKIFERMDVNSFKKVKT